MAKLKDTTSGFKWGSISSLFMAIIKVLRGFIIPKIFATVSDYGLFSSIGVFTRYLQFSDFGARTYLSKKLPHYHLNESEESNEDLINTTFGFILTSFLLIIIYLGICSIFYSGENEGFYKVALLLLIPITILSKCKEFLVAIALSRQDYKISSMATILTEVISFILTVLGIFLFGAIGGVFALGFVHGIVFIFLLKKVSVNLKIKFNFQVMKHIKLYWKLFSISILENIGNTIDLLFVLAIFSQSDFGLYNLGTTFAWVIVAISSVFLVALVPKFFAFIETKQERIDEMTHLTIFSYLLLCTILIIPLSICVNLLIEFYLTKYTFGLKFYFLMIFSGVLRSASIILRQIYVAKNAEKSYLKRMIFNIVISLLVYVCIYFLKLPITEIMYAIIFIDLVFFLILYLKFISYRYVSVYIKNFLFIIVNLLCLTSYQVYIMHIESWTQKITYNVLLFIFLVGMTGFFGYKHRMQIKSLVKA